VDFDIRAVYEYAPWGDAFDSPSYRLHVQYWQDEAALEQISECKRKLNDL